uniref:Uncharacterized protein n=1 Tax=Physcomitrium patens TaxID=3218 RepID=A0A2K1KHM8_PHYPA|nr:hypothetical protein PHYPA_009658 [Physcomitrium patens]
MAYYDRRQQAPLDMRHRSNQRLMQDQQYLEAPMHRTDSVHLQIKIELFLIGQAADKGFVTTYIRRYLTSDEGCRKVVLVGFYVDKLYKLKLNTVPQGPFEGCAIEKSTRLIFPKQQSSSRAEILGSLFHNGVCGSMHHESFVKTQYYVSFKDDYLGYRIGHCTRHKCNVLQKFKKLCNSVP